VKTSITPTYDSRQTGPRYWVTTEIDGKAIEFQRPIDDPFVRKTVNIDWRWFSWLPWPSRKLTVTVLVGADRELMDDVLELDDNQLVAGRSRRVEFNAGMHRALADAAVDEELREMTEEAQT
jgi:hypothetical protein